MLFPPARTRSPQPLPQALGAPRLTLASLSGGFPAPLHQSTCSLAMLLPLFPFQPLYCFPDICYDQRLHLYPPIYHFFFIPVLSSTGDGFLFLEHFPSPSRSSINTCWVIGWEYLSSSSSKLPSILSRAGQAAATLQHGERVALTPSCQNFQES